MTMRRDGFTITDLIVTLAVIAVFAGLALPAASLARSGSRASTSIDNLRTLSAAHFVYSVDWNGRQITYVDDFASTYGDYGDWWQEYNDQHGSSGTWGDPGNHPPVTLGWGRVNDRVALFAYEVVQNANAGLVFPINWDAPGAVGIEFYGSFRFPNAAQFHQYLDGRFYDHVFYAPADDAVIESIGEGFEIVDEYWNEADVQGLGSIPAWSSYCNSPAAMVDPDVMRHDDSADPDANGWTDPFGLPFGWRSPSIAQITYPSLKTHVLEHHWLQQPPSPNCNPAFDPGTFRGCEPYYFNHGRNSAPLTLFYDGHVENVSVQRAMDDDAAVRAMTGNDNWGLWSKDTPWGDDGYRIEYGYDTAETSFHILTTDGAQGRDVLAEGAASPARGPRRGPDRVRRSPPPVRPAPGDLNAARSCFIEE